MVKRNLPGYAIGGLSGGEAKEAFCRVVSHCTDRLPANKPIYCMGVGCVSVGAVLICCRRRLGIV